MQSESGKILLNHYGAESIVFELNKIKTYVEPRYHDLVDRILHDIKVPDVPPLRSKVPLSYRSDDNPTASVNNVGSTATPIVGKVESEASQEQLMGYVK